MNDAAADLILLNGKIYSRGAAAPADQALVVKGERILYVGDAEEARSWRVSQTRQIDLEGRLVLPGFFDSHIHATSAVDELYSVMLTGLTGLEAYRGRIREFLVAHPDLTALYGVGWLPPSFPAAGPTCQMLDDLVPHLPAVLMAQDYHNAWVNSRALELAGVSAQTPDPLNGVIERNPDGTPSGTLRESATELVEGLIPPFSVEQYIAGMRAFQARAHAWGLTAVHIPHLDEPETELEALRRLDESGELKLRVVVGLNVKPDDGLEVVEELAEQRASRRGRMFEIRTAKIFMDGVIEGGTAFLDEPYAHRPGFRGEPLWELGHYNRMCAALERAGFQIHVHAIGDAAVGAALDGFEYARRINGAPGQGERPPRHGITHLQLVRASDFARFARLGVVAFPQPYWFVMDSFYDLAVEFLGPERADRQYPFKSFIDHGVTVTSSSDYPVTIPPRPLDAIESGVRRALPGQTGPAVQLPPTGECASLIEMIDSFTRGSAEAFFMEDRLGALEPGKLADLVVLDQDIFRLAPHEIHRANVDLTMVNGEVVWQRQD